MKKNIFLIVSLIINVLFIIAAGLYFFTPFMDYAMISKSLPRMCQWFQKNIPTTDYANVKICNIK